METKAQALFPVNSATDTAPATIEAVPMINQLNGPKQYQIRGGNNYFIVGDIPLIDRIPAGCYRPHVDDKLGPFLKTVPVNTDKLLVLPYKVFSDVIRDIRTFWKVGSDFKRYSLVHKRGILLYGPPGSGKSSLILLVQKMIIEEQDGIVMVLSSRADISDFIAFMEAGFKTIEPERPVVVLIEDIDGLLKSEETEAVLLQLLDGAKQMNNIVYLATTNHLERLEARITNRPSRFDRVYHIGYPDADIRRYYLEQVILPEDLEKHDLERWVTETAGFTFAHLRDMIVSIILLGISFEETIEHLRGLGKKRDHSQGKGGIGFGKAGADIEEKMEYLDGKGSASDVGKAYRSVSGGNVYKGGVDEEDSYPVRQEEPKIEESEN